MRLRDLIKQLNEGLEIEAGVSKNSINGNLFKFLVIFQHDIPPRGGASVTKQLLADHPNKATVAKLQTAFNKAKKLMVDGKRVPVALKKQYFQHLHVLMTDVDSMTVPKTKFVNMFSSASQANLVNQKENVKHIGRSLMNNDDVNSVDKEMITSFLSMGETSDEEEPIKKPTAKAKRRPAAKKPPVYKTNQPPMLKGECGEWFQRFLFGDKEQDVWLGGDEDNTELEERLIKFFEKYLYATTNLDMDEMDDMKRLVKCRDSFKQWLTPKAKVQYRGIRYFMSRDEFLRKIQYWMDTDKVYKFPGSNKEWIKYESGNYTPKHNIESWTDSPRVADGFAWKWVEEFEQKYLFNAIQGPEEQYDEETGEYWVDESEVNPELEIPVMIVAKTDDSFFGSQKFGVKLNKIIINSHDVTETFRLGTDSIKADTYIDKSIVDEARWADY